MGMVVPRALVRAHLHRVIHSGHHDDKLIHFAEYAVLAALVVTGLSEVVSWPAGYRAALAFGACLVFGALDEVYQHSMSGRAADYLDFVSDVAGALAGQSVLIVGRIRKGRA